VIRAGRLLALVAVLLWSLAPFLWQLVTSLKPGAEITALPPLLPERVTFAHYAAIFTDTSFLRLMANSAVVAAGATLLAVALGALAAFALAKLHVRRRALILALVLAVSMFPPIATVSPLFLVINALGLRDTLTALIFTYTGFALPLAIWLLTGFFRHVPDEIYLAARVDGCTPFQAFRRVLLPLAAPGLVTTAVLAFILCWNEFLYALSFTATDAARTLPVGIALFPGLHEVPWGEIAAACVAATAPVLLLALLFHRRIVEGLAAGAVKG
jgi:trehalose/maltose transport system permease protein